jgi:glycosyltransferase involved in cell wall biosynthesis
MRVAVVVPDDPDVGPDGLDPGDLVAGLVERGDEVTVYRPDPDNGYQNVRMIALDLPASAGPRDVGAITALRRALREDPVDVVHAFGLRAGFVAGVARPAGLPLVVSWYGEPGPGGVRRTATIALARLVAASADLVLYAWPDLAAAARRLDDDRVRRAPVLAPDLPHPARDRAQVRAEFGLDPDAPLVFTAGRLDPYHHHEVLVAAAARWRELHPHPTVLIAGVGPAYRSLAAQAVVGRAPVLLIGERDDMADLLGAADVVVTGVTTPRLTREALATGSALVAPDVGAVPELVGVGAVLVPDEDVDALDVAVRGLLADPDRRRELGRAGRARAMAWSTRAEAIDEIRSGYEELRLVSAARDAPGDLR